MHIKEIEDSKSIQATSLQTAAPIEATGTVGNINSAGLAAIDNTDFPSSGPSVLEQKIIWGWDVMKLGMAVEKQIGGQIDKSLNRVEQHQKTIDLLLDFQSELSKNPQEATPTITRLTSQLKDHGIDLEFSKDRIPELRSLISSRIDKERSDLQILYTTKVQLQIQNMGSMIDILKITNQYENRFRSTITNNMTKH